MIRDFKSFKVFLRNWCKIFYYTDFLSKWPMIFIFYDQLCWNILSKLIGTYMNFYKDQALSICDWLILKLVFTKVIHTEQHFHQFLRNKTLIENAVEVFIKILKFHLYSLWVQHGWFIIKICNYHHFNTDYWNNFQEPVRKLEWNEMERIYAIEAVLPAHQQRFRTSGRKASRREIWFLVKTPAIASSLSEIMIRMHNSHFICLI